MSTENRFHELTTFNGSEFEEKTQFCISCGSNSLAYWDSVRSMEIVKCGNCGIKFVNPLPTDECLERLYAGGVERWTNIEEYERSRNDYFIFYLAQLQRLNPQGKRLLDIGCGVGSFMKMAEARGLSTFGVDISLSDLAIAKSRGLNVQQTKKVSEVSLSGFDFCTMLDFLEHIKDPNSYMRFVHENLADAGILLIDTGDTGGVPGTVGKSRNTFVQNEGHISFYDDKSISKLLGRSGFEIIQRMNQSQVRDISLIQKIYRFAFSRPNLYIFAKKQ